MTTDELRNEIRTEFNSLRAEFKAEEEKTRRRFDEFVEELREIVKVAMVRKPSASTSTRVD